MNTIIHYTKYDTATGEILEGGSTNALLTDIPLETGQSIIEGIYDVGTYKIIEGEIVEQVVDILPTLRIQRNTLLAESDWTQLDDSPLTGAKKIEWATYRQELRDLPATNTATEEQNVSWPIQPSN